MTYDTGDWGIHDEASFRNIIENTCTGTAIHLFVKTILLRMGVHLDVVMMGVYVLVMLIHLHVIGNQ